MRLLFLSLIPLALLAACAAPEFKPMRQRHDVIIRNGAVYDGSGSPSIQADIAIDGQRINQIGALSNAQAKLEIDARGLAVAPGFINMLSWATESLIVDGRSESDIRQG